MAVLKCAAIFILFFYRNLLFISMILARFFPTPRSLIPKIIRIENRSEGGDGSSHWEGVISLQHGIP